MAARPALGLVLLLAGALPARADYMDHFAVREDVGLHKAPYLGPAELLVIPVQVNGTPDPPLNVAAIQAFFADDAPDGFVTYFRTASLGRYQPHVTVGPLVVYPSCPLRPDLFPNCVVARGDVNALVDGMDMMRDIVRQEHALGVDFAQFDVNGRRGQPDNFVDGVMILTNVRFGGIAFPIAYFNNGDNLAGGMGGALVLDGTSVSHIAISGYGNAFVLCHEFSHVLGLTDLYDESFHYDGLHYSQMGDWLYDPKIPLPDAETRYRWRWGNVFQVSGTQRLHLRPAEVSGDVARMGTGAEYFLFENRGPGEFDRAFQSRGLVAYHVDRTGLDGREGQFTQRLFSGVEDDPWHPYIRNVQADGRFEFEAGGHAQDSDIFHPGDSLAPDPSGIPISPSHQVQSSNYYSGQPSGFIVGDIAVNDDGSIDATFEAPVTDPCTDLLCDDGGVGCAPANCPLPKSGCAAAPTGACVALAVLAAGWSRRRAAGVVSVRGK